MTDRTPARFQFGIRHLLLTTAAVAVVVGVSAPLMRDWDADQWNRLWPMGFGLALFMAIFAPLHVSARNQMKRSLGPIRWVVRQTRGRNSQSASVYATLAVIGTVIFVIGQVLMVSLDRRGMPQSYWRWFPWAFLGIVPGYCGGQAWYRSALVSIGDHGIGIGIGFAPWKDVACSYEPEGKPVPLLLKLGRHVIKLHPPAEQEREIAEYLLARCRPWDGSKRPTG